MLILGLYLFGAGEAALVAANAGQSPWVVFAEGLEIQTGLSIGWATAIISVGVLLLWIPLKRKPGAGTLLNVVVIAAALEFMIQFYPQPTNQFAQLAQTLFGIGLVGLGSALYIPAHLGPGPRDGLMTGLHFKTGIPVARIRLSIEIVVMTIGWLLGGTLGIGTFIFAATVGYAVAFWFGVVHRIDQKFPTKK